MLLEIKGLRKSYGAVEALRHADLSINKAEVVALLGDNGAGKSTFVQILSGAVPACGGSFSFLDQELDLSRYNVRKARRLGIETVYQDRCLCEEQSLWRNLFVDRHIRTPWGFIDQKAEKKITQDLLENWFGLQGVGIDPDALVRVLSGGERQALAIGRALYFGASLIILDEPTTALSLKESQKVLDFITKLKQEGRSVLIISHNIHQAFAVADRFVFMQKGCTVHEMNKNQTNPQELSAFLLELAEERNPEVLKRSLKQTANEARYEN